LGLFGLAAVLASFQKNWAIFYQNNLVTLVLNIQGATLNKIRLSKTVNRWQLVQHQYSAECCNLVKMLSVEI
jgi:hypothetical protein